MLLRIGCGDHALDVIVTLIRDDGLCVVILCFLYRLDDGLHIYVLTSTNHLMTNLVIPLEKLHCKESLLALWYVGCNLLLDLKDGIHHVR